MEQPDTGWLHSAKRQTIPSPGHYCRVRGSFLKVQVCESIAEQQTRKREITALSEAMAEMKLMEGTIVTRKDDEVLPLESGTINVVPAWRFLLNLSYTA